MAFRLTSNFIFTAHGNTKWENGQTDIYGIEQCLEWIWERFNSAEHVSLINVFHLSIVICDGTKS